MQGIQIRLSRFTDEGSRLVDLTLGAEYRFTPSAYIAYPHHVGPLAKRHPDRGDLFLLMRLTSFDGENILRLYDPGTVPFWGGDGCLVDLVSGHSDRLELDSLEILGGIRRQAHALGLPVVCRVMFDAEPYREDIASNLNVPLTIAEEMGADALIIPPVADEEVPRLRRPLVPIFLTVGEGAYESRMI